MANKLKTTLKGYFETGDVPNQNQYGDLIDSNLNLTETGTQVAAGTISASSFISENDLYVKGNITASNNISASGTFSITGDITSSGTVKASTGSFSNLQGNSPITVKDEITFQSTVSASGDLYVSGSIVYTTSTATNISATGHITASGRIQTLSHITASGNISSSGKILAGDYILDGVALTTTFTELNYLDGITSAQGGYVIGNNQSVATTASPTFSALSLTKTAKSGVGVYGDSVNTGAGKSITFIITGIPTIPGKASGKIQKSAPTLVLNSSTGATDTVIVNCTTDEISVTVFGQSTAYDALTNGFYISLGNEGSADFTATSASFSALII